MSAIIMVMMYRQMNRLSCHWKILPSMADSIAFTVHTMSESMDTMPPDVDRRSIMLDIISAQAFSRHDQPDNTSENRF